MSRLRRVAGPGYAAVVNGVRPTALVGHWPLDDKSGLVLRESKGLYGGVYVAPTLGQPGLDNKTSVKWDGASTIGNVYSAALASVFPSASGSFIIWAKVANAGVWSGGSAARVVFAWTIGGGGSNRIQVYRYAYTVGRLVYSFIRGGVAYTANLDGLTTLDWMCLGATWTSGRARCYYQGSLVAAESTAADVFAGALASTGAVFGTGVSTGGNNWSGWLQHAALWNVELTPAEMKMLADVRFVPNLVGYGDSITAGTGASDAAHRWLNIVSATKGWPCFTNNGVSGTTLQNTTQNTVALIGGATSGNGRDNWSARLASPRPWKICCLYGLNDLRLNDPAFSENEYANDLGEVVDLAVAAGCPADGIVIGSPPYMNNYAAGGPTFNGGSALKHAAYVAQAAAVAAAKGCRYVDVYAWMVANGGDALIGADGIHPNDAGHAAIAAAFLSVL